MIPSAIAAIRAYGVVDEIEALLHRRNPVGEDVDRHAGTGMGDGMGREGGCW